MVPQDVVGNRGRGKRIIRRIGRIRPIRPIFGTALRGETGKNGYSVEIPGQLDQQGQAVALHGLVGGHDQDLIEETVYRRPQTGQVLQVGLELFFRQGTLHDLLQAPHLMKEVLFSVFNQPLFGNRPGLFRLDSFQDVEGPFAAGCQGGEVGLLLKFMEGSGAETHFAPVIPPGGQDRLHRLPAQAGIRRADGRVGG